MSLEQQIDSVSYREEQNLDTLLAQIHSLAAKADNAGRVKTLDKLRDLSYSIETADDTAKRLLYNVSTDVSSYAPGQLTGNAQNLAHATIRIGIDLKLFDILCEASGPLTTTQLAGATGATSVFLGLSRISPITSTLIVIGGI